ncbi:LAME_0G07074g1_1 [Lachancea meyersii CBS 8951]|uniref:LAME_0G07074g1_1 n=1 Tax=Lachancea meyersii CBS 8951 TaxID=1266667 RepID=A0A1G4K7Y5_9SACH|nr:LAME_0G07074g1_1 [Lachancea meyersii CBS 8951]
MAFHTKSYETLYPGQLICPTFELGEKKEETQEIIRYVAGNGVAEEDYEVKGHTMRALTATVLGDVSFVEEQAKQIPTEAEHTKDEKEKDLLKEEKKEEITADSNPERTFFVTVTDAKAAKKDVNEDFANNLPREGSVVLARITRISSQRANVEILALENKALPVDSGVGSNGSGVTAPGGGSAAATLSISQASSDLGETFRGIISARDVRATDRDRVKIMESFRPGDIVRAQVISLGDGSNYHLSTARNDLGVVFARAFNGAGGLMYAIDWQTMVAPNTGFMEPRKCAKPF